MEKIPTITSSPSNQELKCAELARKFIENMTGAIDKNWKGMSIGSTNVAAEGVLLGSIAIEKYRECKIRSK